MPTFLVSLSTASADWELASSAFLNEFKAAEFKANDESINTSMQDEFAAHLLEVHQMWCEACPLPGCGWGRRARDAAGNAQLLQSPPQNDNASVATQTESDIRGFCVAVTSAGHTCSEQTESECEDPEKQYLKRDGDASATQELQQDSSESEEVEEFDDDRNEKMEMKHYTKESIGLAAKVEEGEEEESVTDVPLISRSKKGRKMSRPRRYGTQHLYYCPECNKRCSSLSDYEQHVNSHDTLNFLQTSEYQQRVSKEKRLQHMSVGAEQFSCSECGKSFAQKVNLKQHYITHSGEKPHTCSVCSKNFARKSTLTRHFKIHKGAIPVPKSHRCSVCDTPFASKRALKEHHIQTGEKPHQCSICNKKFVLKKDRDRHLKIHTGEKPHECSACGKKFIHKYALRQHMIIHTGEKPFQCPVCQKRFTHKGTLIQHARTHTGEKPYQCSICKNTFAQQANLDQHMPVHTGEKPFLCTVCGTSFSNKSNLSEHMNIHTGERPYLCTVCGSNFAQKVCLRQHMRIHTGEKPHKCSLCPNSYRDKRTLKNHMRTHTGEKPSLTPTNPKPHPLPSMALDRGVPSSMDRSSYLEHGNTVVHPTISYDNPYFQLASLN